MPSTPSYNRPIACKMEIDERLGENATISSVLYANLSHPELKTDYPGKSGERAERIMRT